MVFNLKGYLLTLDPKFKTLLETEDEHNELYHDQWALARLITALVVDSDATYVVASRIRRHEDRPRTAALAGLADTYQYDPVDHV